MRGAAAGAAVLEGWARDLDEAEALAAGGGLDFAPNHHHDAVGPMTGIITRGMPVMVVENRTFGNRAYCTVNEGARQGDALRRQRRRGAGGGFAGSRRSSGRLSARPFEAAAAFP